ncbi:MAG: polynucleotide adenylyltransferase [Desulfovibrionaceae bacterium]
MTEYLVGGAVRDLVLGCTPSEFDLTFTGTGEEFLSTHPEACKVGRSTAVFLYQGREHMPLRGNNIQEDLLARDLTINALALEVNGTVHCHPLALHDLQHKILRPASAKALADDPGRAFRLARFAAHFHDFTVDAEAYTQMRSPQVQEAQIFLPAERVGRELLKALGSPKPSRFLHVLDQGKMLEPWFSELTDADNLPAGPPQWHRGSVLEHISHVMDTVAGDPLAVWMALCHDLGKISTPTDILPHHYGHEKRGMPAATQLGTRLALPTRYIMAGALAAREHMKGGTYEQLRVGTRRDLLISVHNAGLDKPFWALVNADSHKDLASLARQDLHTLLQVQLPLEWHNRGKASADKLRAMHCAALLQ